MVDEDIRHIAQRVEALRHKHRNRDRRAAEVKEVRNGNFDVLAPHLFSDDWPRSVVANRIDVMARHTAAALAVLPSFTCQSSTTKSPTAREFADKRTKILNNYFTRSRVQAQMQTAADQFWSYGLIVTCVDPDFVEQFPDILTEDPTGYYPVWDRKGRTVEMARVFLRSPLELVAEYPDLELRVRAKYGVPGTGGLENVRPVEVVKWCDRDRVVMYLSEHPDVVLVDYRHKVGRCPYVATKRPGLDDEVRGAFDDLIWVQLALHSMRTMTLQASAQALNAPIVVPPDVTDFGYGPNEVIRTSNPQGVARVKTDIPAAAWAAGAQMEQDIEFGSMVPEAMSGSIDASVITGKGVQQLVAGYSQQVANAQQSLVGHFQEVGELAFLTDETYWPDVDKRIHGHHEGTPYDFTYRPNRDIKGDYTFTVQYGGVAGLDPNRALVFLLQAEAAQLVSRDLVRRSLPIDMSPSDEEDKITTEQMRNSLVQALAGTVQAMPQLIMNGQDPSELISRIAQAIREKQKGKPIEDVLAELFPPPEPTPAAGLEALPGGASPDGGMAGGLTPSGLPPGLRPGMATEGPGARPPMEMVMAGLTAGGQPNLQSGVSRMTPARTV